VFNEGTHPKSIPARIRSLLEGLYPQKAVVIGGQALSELVAAAIERSAKRAAKLAQSTVIHAVHMFYLGSDFETDPCYPWTGDMLANGATGSMDERYMRMHRLTLAHLRRSFQFEG